MEAASNEGDIVCDFFAGSGTTAACSRGAYKENGFALTLESFQFMQSRKRMIGSSERTKKERIENWRAFEILNLGKYQRQHYVYDGKTERDEVKKHQRIDNQRERVRKTLILEAYQGNQAIDGFATIHGKKGGDFVFPWTNQPTTIEKSCRRSHFRRMPVKNKITSVDILGFEYEMGLFPTIQEEAKAKGSETVIQTNSNGSLR